MLKTHRLTILLVILIIFSLILSGCSIKPEKKYPDGPVEERDFFLGTLIKIKLYDNASEKAFNEAFNKLREIQEKMTINAGNSEVIEINENAGKDYVKVSNDTFYVIKKGKYFSELSKGRFDIAIGPLVKLWNIGFEDAKVPPKSKIESKKELLNYRDVLLNEKKKSVMLKKEGMLLDLGGIAKGYGADAVVEILKDNGVTHGIVNLGGNIYAFGQKPDGEPWRIGIQNPFLPRGDYVGIVQLIDKTVVTSGIYERNFEYKGKLYHHILDPETGYPVENNLASVSIIADKSIDADSLSTTAYTLGLDKGFRFIEELENTEAIFITKDSEMYVTEGLKDKFEITDSSFTLKKK